MSVFNPECTSNYFQVLDIDPSECTGGNPYGFACRIKVGERSFDFDGLDMGDLQTMKGAINELIVETAEVTVRVPFNGYELDDLEKQIDRCFNED